MIVARSQLGIGVPSASGTFKTLAEGYAASMKSRCLFGGLPVVSYSIRGAHFQEYLPDQRHSKLSACSMSPCPLYWACVE